MRRNWKTTLIAGINLAALCLLLILLSIDRIDSEDFMLILGGVNSAVVTILGLFTADIKKKEE